MTRGQPEQITSKLSAMFGPTIFVASHDVKAPADDLFAAEKTATTHMVAARHAEFQAGRHAARLALRQAGATAQPIPMGDDRAPIWPSGFTGSISHGGGFAIAAATALSQHRSVGLDIEPASDLAAELWDQVLTISERDWLDGQPYSQQGILAKVMFSIKECAYKAQYPLSRQVLGFDALTTQFSQSTGGFDAVFQPDVAPFYQGQKISGKFAITHGLILSTALI